MNISCWICVIFYVSLWTISETTAQNAKCVYKYINYWTKGYKTTNDSYYTCALDTKQAKFNEKLTTIDGQHLTGHSDAYVKYIANYKDNKLKIFSSIFCQKFPNLEVISIYDAELEAIDEDSLANCKNLFKWFLNGNKIRELPKNLLIRNLKLTHIWIHKNQLTTLPENVFLNQNELYDLYLQENQISSLSRKIFHPLVKLEVLLLYNNKLQSINPEWFVNLQNLKWLSFGINKISEIPPKCFLSLRNLEILWLDKNKIKTLKFDNFDGLQNLQLLRLDSNEICDLPVSVFFPLSNLKELDLHDNKLTTITSDSFGIQIHLTKVGLQNNQVNAIDQKFIDNTKVSQLNMNNNICCQLLIGSRSEMKPNLKKCFDNYKPRHQPQTYTYSQTYRPMTLTQQATKRIITCGTTKTGHGNIIGGTHINSGDYPWIAALMTPAGKFFCGGTVVSSRKVVTAAHCIQNKKTFDRLSAGNLVVLLGMHDLKNPIEIGRASYAVYSISVHPDWNTLTQSFDADIAVLVLEQKITFNEFVQPICMPNLKKNIETIKTGVVVGYGKSEDETKLHENIPKILATPIHSNQDCFKDNEGLALISSGRTFCGGSGRGVGVCNGDSGSGMTVTIGNGYYLRGVVSSSLLNAQRGCDVDTYSIFTDVLKFADWIDGIPVDRFARNRKK